MVSKFLISFNIVNTNGKLILNQYCQQQLSVNSKSVKVLSTLMVSKFYISFRTVNTNDQ